jgi:competence protein ComEC
MRTGMHVPIIRSFVMACLFTVALMADRRPFSLRGLALAATVLMLIAPQEVPGVSFQMSFSAVLALIAGYEACVHGCGGCMAKAGRGGSCRIWWHWL